MKRHLFAVLAGLAFIIGYALVWCLIVEPNFCEEPLDVDPVYHGADMITVGWDGRQTAYKWRDGEYKVMWARR